MDLTFLRILLSRKEVKIIILTTVTGGILQIICRRYIKSHPELLEEKTGNLKEAEPRGGSIEVSFISIKVIAEVAIKFIAEKGLLAGLAAGSGIALTKIPTSAISTYLRDAFP